MGFKEIIQRLKGNTEDKESLNEHIKELDKRRRAEEIVTDRTKSANQRELERYLKENQEQRIKEELEFRRNERAKDITFNHNSINTPNIMKKQKGDWEIMKERNLFSSQGNMFSNQKNIFKPKRK